MSPGSGYWSDEVCALASVRKRLERSPRSTRRAWLALEERYSDDIGPRAYNQSPEAVAFYEFTRTMQSYKSMIAENTTLVLSTSSDLFKFLKGMTPDGDVVPAPRSVGNR
jgi:hypothetical protein